MDGYKCTDDVTICLGHTGKQVLNSLHLSFDVFDSKNRLKVYLQILLAIALVWKILFIFVMIRRTSEQSSIKDIEHDPDLSITSSVQSTSSSIRKSVYSLREILPEETVSNHV